ncbi:MAG TPA: TIGR02453 family protein [Thermodesulfobacteriota bacterium]|nr:TIGR02453 family protein [Thermodesulfobacteriota bacterium]
MPRAPHSPDSASRRSPRGRAAAEGTAHFSPALFAFLRELAAHNDRAWFLANKSRYDADVREPMLRFIADFGPHLRRISRYFIADPRPVGGSMFRIHRDTRFSRDKRPYKTVAAARFPHAAASRDVHAPGFYLHLEPGNCFAGAGLWHPDAAALRRVREAIVARPTAWRAVLAAGLPLGGGTLRRPPRGYDPAHPFVEDLKRTDFVTTVSFSEAEVCGPRFLEAFAEACRAASPLVEFVTKALGLRW